MTFKIFHPIAIIAALTFACSPLSARADTGDMRKQQAIQACKTELPRDVVRFCPCIEEKLEAAGASPRPLTPEERAQRLKTAIASCQNDAMTGGDPPEPDK